MRPSVLWGTAVVSFAFGLILLTLPGDAAAAGIAFGDVTFSFGQLCILVAVAAAWGDMRAANRERDHRHDATDRRIERIEKHVFGED
jgi:hypothetical protein